MGRWQGSMLSKAQEGVMETSAQRLMTSLYVGGFLILANIAATVMGAPDVVLGSLCRWFCPVTHAFLARLLLCY